MKLIKLNQTRTKTNNVNNFFRLGNILIDESRNLKITDFGLSRVSYRKGHGIFYCTSYAGTESYMSPQGQFYIWF